MRLNNRQLSVCYLAMIEASDSDIRFLIEALKDPVINKWMNHMQLILNMRNSYKPNVKGV